MPCRTNEFECANGYGCFDYKFVCDLSNHHHCQDGSDQNSETCGKFIVWDFVYIISRTGQWTHTANEEQTSDTLIAFPIFIEEICDFTVRHLFRRDYRWLILNESALQNFDASYVVHHHCYIKPMHNIIISS